jgi:FkbM family methyltransferase
MNISDLNNKLNKLGVILRSYRLLKAFLVHRVFAATEHQYVFKHKFQTIVDVGANKGQFSLASRFYSPHAFIYAFEPLANPASVYKRLFLDDPKVVFFNNAIGPENATTEIHVSGRDDSSSLLPITNLQSDVFPGTEEVSIASISVSTLDSNLNIKNITSPSLLKLDVQGFELQALRGCESLLRNFDVVYCECSFLELYSGQSFASDIIRWLDERGFRFVGFYNPSFDSSGRAIQADFLFEKNV